jgi:hypothetical protein
VLRDLVEEPRLLEHLEEPRSLPTSVVIEIHDHERRRLRTSGDPRGDISLCAASLPDPIARSSGQDCRGCAKIRHI